MIKLWSKFHFQILWYSFAWDNRFLVTPSLISYRKILPPAPLDTSATALVCIFSPILNSVMEAWKCRSTKLLSPKNKQESKHFLEICMKFFSNLPQVLIITSPSKRKLTISPKNVFFNFCSAEREEDYGAEKMTKIKLTRVLVTSFDKFRYFCNLSIFGFCSIVL